MHWWLQPESVYSPKTAESFYGLQLLNHMTQSLTRLNFPFISFFWKLSWRRSLCMFWTAVTQASPATQFCQEPPCSSPPPQTCPTGTETISTPNLMWDNASHLFSSPFFNFSLIPLPTHNPKGWNHLLNPIIFFSRLFVLIRSGAWWFTWAGLEAFLNSYRFNDVSSGFTKTPNILAFGTDSYLKKIYSWFLEISVFPNQITICFGQ